MALAWLSSSVSKHGEAYEVKDPLRRRMPNAKRIYIYIYINGVYGIQ